MSQPETAAARIAELLQTDPELAASGVERVHVFPRLDGLYLQFVTTDGGFQQVGIKIPTWYPEFRDDEVALVKKVAQLIPKRLPDRFWDDKGRLDLQYLFLRVTADLIAVSRSHDDYDNLRAAALLRLLLLDNPLIHQVNRHHRLPIAFLVGQVLIDDVVDPRTLPPSPKPRLVKTHDGRRFHAAGNALDPEFFRGHAKEMKWDDFLSAYVMKVDEHFVSVADLVAHMANVEGLAHAAGPKGKRPADASLQRWRRMVQVNGRGPALETIAAIGRVVWTALVPLIYECERAVEAGLPFFADPTEDDAGSPDT